MTASSVQFLSSRRVQLVGMPQGTTTRPLPIDIKPEFSRDAPVLTPQRVSRNLFGSPKSGEIGELLVRETAQRRSYILQRYNFDILSPSTNITASKSAQITAEQCSNNNVHSERLPSLIEKELLDQEKRLSGDVSNLCSSAKSKSHSPSSYKSILKKSEQVHKQNGSRAISDSTAIGITAEACVSAAKAGPSESSERLKPYARQTLITDCYCLRKTNNGQNNRTAIAIVVASHQQKIDVLPLPKPICATESSILSSATLSDSTKEESNSQPLELTYK